MLLATLAMPAGAVLVGQSDDLSALQFWQRGSIALPGPGGATDAYLRVDADGVSDGGSIVTFNQAQWSGDYIATGVKSISMKLANLGASPLDVRLAFGNANAPRLGGSWYATTGAIALAPGSGWRQVAFDIGPTDLVLVKGTATYTQVMTNVFTLRILNASAPSAQGESVFGSLGIDDIEARATLGCPRCGNALIGARSLPELRLARLALGR